MNENLAALLPETILAGGAVLGLLAGAWLPRHRQWIVAALTTTAALAGLVATGVTAARGSTQVVFGSEFAVDTATQSGRVVILAALLLVVCLSVETVRAHPRESEFYVLLLLASTGTLAMTGANDLLMLYSGYLLASLPSATLAGFAKDTASTEAALKYYLMAALPGVIMLTGITLLYGAARATDYTTLHSALASAPHLPVAAGGVAVLAGLLFKIGGVPVHFWVPDVTDGTPGPVAAYLTTVPKIGGLIAAYRLLGHALPTPAADWPLLVAVVAAASMTLGNLAAFFQTSAKRLLAYSTISQVGYLLIAVAVASRTGLAQRSLLFYLAGYAVTNLGVFAVVTELPHARTLADYRGLARRHPGLAAVLLVCLLGLVGTPPTSVFVGKLEVFSAAIDGRYTWLAVLAVANTVASLFYYLRWLLPAFSPEPANAADPLAPAGRWTALGAYAAGTTSVALGLISGVILPLSTGSLLR